MPDNVPPPIRSQQAAAQYLDSLQQAGLTHLPRPKAKAAPPAVPAQPVARRATAGSAERAARPASPPAGECLSPTPPAPGIEPPAAIGPSPTPPPSPPRGASSSTDDSLAALASRVAACTRCAHLAQERTQTVFGVGNPRPRLVFMGEAPGADEDLQGEPFVGRAGQLLNKIIEACGLRRQDVYILNTIKCRPPGNRQPTPTEADNCREYLDAQLDLLKPECICCLGATAAQSLLRSTETIGRMRGRLYDYRGIKVVCTYHPAYLLRSPEKKRDTWEDMKFLLGQLGLPVPKPAS